MPACNVLHKKGGRTSKVSRVGRRRFVGGPVPWQLLASSRRPALRTVLHRRRLRVSRYRADAAIGHCYISILLVVIPKSWLSAMLARLPGGHTQARLNLPLQHTATR